MKGHIKKIISVCVLVFLLAAPVLISCRSQVEQTVTEVTTETENTVKKVYTAPVNEEEESQEEESTAESSAETSSSINEEEESQEEESTAQSSSTASSE